MAAADRRAAILAAALEAFSSSDFHETSLEAVAERAGVSKALIYEHFSSKRELHAAVLETYVSELLRRVIGAITAAPGGGQRLRGGADAFLAFVEERREAWRMLVRNPEDPGVAASVARLQQEAAAAIATLIEADAPQGDEAPRERQLAIEMLAQQQVGALRALANWWDDNRDVPREAVLKMLMEFAWLGLERLSRGERWDAESPV